MLRMRKHIKGLDLNRFISELAEYAEVAGECFGIAGYVYYAIGGQGRDAF